jgi:DNA-directed RNA polymerase subunit RPC12/RpoP
MTADGGKTAGITCPRCPTFGSFAGTHEVAADGKVTPSVVCPNCDFHEFVTLEGWAP